MSCIETEFDAGTLKRLRRNLVAWYERNARDLPWRRSHDAYRIWISEIMLQQTTVAAVVPYYERFLGRFPSVATLADAREDDVLRLWEGLGYYSRARNIHAAAKRIVTEYGGSFPDNVDELRSLPGIGRYTAGAIASFAYDRCAPIVEANTLRLYCRLLGFRGDPKSGDGQRALWEFAEGILPRRQPGRFNQALMELGSEVCTPVAPDCCRCPLKSCCRAFADGAQAEIPRPAPRPEITRVTEASVAVQNRGLYLLRRNQPGERWQGLWDFLRFAVEKHITELATPRGGNSRAAKTPAKLKRHLANRVAENTGIQASIGSIAAELNHSVTRYRIRLLCILGDYQAGPLLDGENFAWVPPDGLAAYPLSVTGRKFADLLCELHSASGRKSRGRG